MHEILRESDVMWYNLLKTLPAHMMSQMEKSTKPPPSICAPSNTYMYLWLPIFLPYNSNS